MKRFSTMLAGCAIAATALVTPAAAETTAVNVALMDMSAVASGPMGQGFGMMGMMSPGMMGRGGYGPGMMGMMSVRADKTTAKAGSVTFEVTNWSRSVIHEMVVIAVDSPDAPLPYDFSKQIVPEDQVKMLGETNELQPNASKAVELTLTPGTYLLVCNVPGHYAAGMVLPFTVAQ